MAESLIYDDRGLQQLVAELEPKRRLRAIRGGIRKEAKRIQKIAVANLRGSGLRVTDDMEKGIRALVFKKRSGFRITAKARAANRRGKGEAGMHTNRYGQKKPVLHFAESGTAERKTRGSIGLIKSMLTGRKRRKSKRAAHSTGRMKAYTFMKPTIQYMNTTSTENVQTLIIEELTKTAKKYGCK